MGSRKEVMQRMQERIDALEKRMQIDSNDLDYETHLREKRDLQQILDRMKRRAEVSGFAEGEEEGGKL